MVNANKPITSYRYTIDHANDTYFVSLTSVIIGQVMTGGFLGAKTLPQPKFLLLSVIWIIENKFQWIWNQDARFLLHENVLQNVGYKIATILLVSPCVNEMWCNFLAGHCFARVLGAPSLNCHASTREHDTQQYSADVKHDLWEYNYDEQR